MKPEDFDIDEPMGSIDPPDRFDQCDAKENGVGERCTMESDHGGDKHTFEMDLRPEIHDYFGLSYANYLVVNRSLLQSMPEKWQKDFVEMLEKFSREFGWAMELQPAINVQILARSPERIDDEECPNCEGTEFNLDADGMETENECQECDCGRVEAEERVETAEEVGIITDPVPHYERGRSSVPRASQTVEEVGDYSHWRMYGEWLKANHIEQWRKDFGPEFEIEEEVEVTYNPGHVRPPILGDQLGLLDGEIVGIIDHCLYFVNVEVGSETFKVQLHADQLREK
jgi:hypothetical protein